MNKKISLTLVALVATSTFSLLAQTGKPIPNLPTPTNPADTFALWFNWLLPLAMFVVAELGKKIPILQRFKGTAFAATLAMLTFALVAWSFGLASFLNIGTAIALATTIYNLVFKPLKNAG